MTGGLQLEQSGEYLIAADRQTVWLALNDPQVLRECIDGCQSMERLSDTEFNAVVKAKIGPVSAVFKATLELSELDPPAGYTITANVKGGAAGFGKGSATVALAEQTPGTTVLTYGAAANVGGKLAQIGSRLIDGAARKMADQFFLAFQQKLAPADGPADSATADATASSGTAAQLGAAAEADNTPGADKQGGHAPQHNPQSAAVDRIGQQDKNWLAWAVAAGVVALAVVLSL